MNENLVKNIYATLHVNELAFKMYKTNKNNTTVFEVKGNIIEIEDDTIKFNTNESTLKEVLLNIKNI